MITLTSEERIWPSPQRSLQAPAILTPVLRVHSSRETWAWRPCSLWAPWGHYQCQSAASGPFRPQTSSSQRCRSQHKWTQNPGATRPRASVWRIVHPSDSGPRTREEEGVGDPSPPPRKFPTRFSGSPSKRREQDWPLRTHGGHPRSPGTKYQTPWEEYSLLWGTPRQSPRPTTSTPTSEHDGPRFWEATLSQGFRVSGVS